MSSSFFPVEAILILVVLGLAAGGCATGGSGVKEHEPRIVKRKPDVPAAPLRVYVGTYTGPKSGSKGIYQFEFDPNTGGLKELGLAAETKNPSFLALSPDFNTLYAVGEMPDFEGKKSGAVSAFAVDRATGSLTLINQQASGGEGPCHVTLTHDGKVALVANYSGGSVASFPLESDGKLTAAASVIQHTGKGTDPGRQEGPHAHGIWPSPDDRYAVACDLGLDKVLVYERDAKAGTLKMLEANAGVVPPGGGARHAAFSPSGKHLYVINEMGNTVTTFEWDAKAAKPTPVQTISTLPEGFEGKSYTSEIVMHPSGKFVYGSNRGHDTLAVYKIDSSSGQLALVEITPMGGSWPRHFNIDPSGKWLIAAGERSNTLAVFSVDLATGKLTQVGEPVACPQPVCVMFAPSR